MASVSEGFQVSRRPSVSRWRAVVLAADRLSAFIIICRLAFVPLPAGTPPLWFCPWEPKHFKANDWVRHASLHLSLPRFLSLFDVWQITRQKGTGSLNSYYSSARVLPPPQKRRLISHHNNGLLNIHISYYFVRLGEIKIDCPVSSIDLGLFWC